MSDQNIQNDQVQNSDEVIKLQQQIKALTEENEQLKEKVGVFDIRQSNNEEIARWEKDKSFKGRMMYLILLYKDTGSRITNSSVSKALDIILKVVDEANKLNADQSELRFADQDLDISNVDILDIFSGAFKVNEISDDFDTLYAKRYYATSVIPLGYNKSTKMPTYREYQEALHVIKAMFKYMKETYISMSSLHSTVNVATAMKECAHKDSNGKFKIARRNDLTVYFIPYYVKDLNDSLTWKNEYYDDNVNIYIDTYFNKFVYPILKGKRD